MALAIFPSYSVEEQFMEEFLHRIARNQFTVKVLVAHLKFKTGLV